MRLSRVLALTFVVALLASSGSAFALDKVRAAKSVEHRLGLHSRSISAPRKASSQNTVSTSMISGLGGDAKLQQALTSDSVDFGLGSGPSMAFAVKGSPVIAVAAFADEPRNISVMVARNSPIKTVADFKGKLISAVTTVGLADRLAGHASRDAGGLGHRMAFAPSRSAASKPSMPAAADRIRSTASWSRSRKAITSKSGAKATSSSAWRNTRRNSTPMSIFARKDLVASNPDVVARFLKGFFASIAYMKTNKDETSKVARANAEGKPAGREQDL